MPTSVLDRPGTACNVPQVARPEAECNPPPPPPPKTAREILAEADWAVMITRAMVLEFNNPQDSAALAVWVACRALTDRGLHGPPSEGWATLTGMSARGFFNARRRAVELGLVRVVPGGGIEPLVRYDGGQFSRVPVAVLFDQTLSRTERRVFIGLSLYSSGLGDSRPAVATIAKASATNIRDVRRALRQLEDHCRITCMGAVGRGNMRYFVTGQAIPRAQKSGKTAHTSTQSYPHNPPAIGTETPPNPQTIGTDTPPNHPAIGTDTPPKSALTPPHSGIREKESRERRAPTGFKPTAPRHATNQPTKPKPRPSTTGTD